MNEKVKSIMTKDPITITEMIPSILLKNIKRFQNRTFARGRCR